MNISKLGQQKLDAKTTFQNFVKIRLCNKIHNLRNISQNINIKCPIPIINICFDSIELFLPNFTLMWYIEVKVWAIN